MSTDRRSASRHLAALALAAVAASNPALAQTRTAPRPPRASFDSSEVAIPMRDGVRLHTTIVAPKGSTADLPFLLTRTPYGIETYGASLATYYAELAEDGYVFVFQDIRGRFGSEGRFVVTRRPRNERDPRAIDESTDTYDTIAWLLEHVPHNNGRVGQLGTSYDGWLTMMSGLDPHPALKAVSPQA